MRKLLFILLVIGVLVVVWYFVPPFQEVVDAYVVNPIEPYLAQVKDFVTNTVSSLLGKQSVLPVATQPGQPQSPTTAENPTPSQATARSRFDPSMFATEVPTGPVGGIEYSNNRISPFTFQKRVEEATQEENILTDEMINVQVIGVVVNKTVPEKSRAIVKLPFSPDTATAMGVGDTKDGYTLLEIHQDKLVFVHEISPERFEVMIR